MNENGNLGTFMVSFNRICPCCGTDCINFEIEEEYTYYIFDKKVRNYICKNEDICKENYRKYAELENSRRKLGSM